MKPNWLGGSGQAEYAPRGLPFEKGADFGLFSSHKANMKHAFSNKISINLLLFGAPGSGKGTQSALLVRHFRLYHISTGELFRKALKEKTPMGLEAQAYMDKGHLVPDSLVIDLLEKALVAWPSQSKAQGGFVLDGFPRTLPQAEALTALLKKIRLELYRVLYLNVPEKVLTERLTGRRVAEKSGLVYHLKFKPPKRENICDQTGEKLIQRKDDTEALVKERLKTYRQQTAPVLEYYKNKQLLLEINGEGLPEQVFSQIQAGLSLR